MEIEKQVRVAASAQRVWSLLLDPQVMGRCVPGMQSIEVLSELEYLAQIQVKIAFVTARFRLRTKIVEQRAPHYLRTEGTGEDVSVASSLRQSSELFLEAVDADHTELRIRVQVEVLGRLGTFGLSVMKTKADRMWDEFVANLVAQIEGRSLLAPEPMSAEPTSPEPVTEVGAQAPPRPPLPMPMPRDPVVGAAAGASSAPFHPAALAGPVAAARAPGFWARLWRRPASDAASGPADGQVRIEWRRGDAVLIVHWPVARAAESAVWLRQVLGPLA